MTGKIEKLFSRFSPLGTIVVKIGSRLITPESPGTPPVRVKRLVQDVLAIREHGCRVVLVSSGAIACGMQRLGLTRRPGAVPMQQACACVGQIQLMEQYTRLFGKKDIPVAQVLLTWDDLRDKQRHLNLRNALFHLLDNGAVPVVNENDSVGTDEIAFGDNDTLGAQIALMTRADLYVILTDVNGLYDANPGKVSTARHIDRVSRITQATFALVSDARNEISVGGMTSKLEAARIATRAGIPSLIANGKDHRLLDAVTETSLGTLFDRSAKKLSTRRRWIAFTRHASGTIVVDDGAEKALVEKGKSLLPAGILKVTGTFRRGDNVVLCNRRGDTIGRGLVNYSASDIELIKGKKSSAIASILSQKPYDEVVHRNNLVVPA